MAKGAGMLAPGLATMLVVITTDAVLTPDILDRELRAATRVTLNRVDSDGCMSTNDSVALLSSGASGIEADPDEFDELLTACCADLANSSRRMPKGQATTSRLTSPTRPPSKTLRTLPGPSAAPTCSKRHLRQGPTLGPSARRRGHYNGHL